MLAALLNYHFKEVQFLTAFRHSDEEAGPSGGVDRKQSDLPTGDNI